MRLKQILLIGATEIIIALALISAAPTFLNSKKPWIGFAIWLSVPTALTGSGIYAIKKFDAANKARKIFIAAFPEHSNLGISEFLELSPAHVAAQLDLLIAIKKNSDAQELNISLFEILEQTKNDKF